MLHIGFTGTHMGMSNRQRAAFQFMIEHMRPSVTLHHGDCVGADNQAHNIAMRIFATGTLTGIVLHPPDKDILRAFCSKDAESSICIEVQRPKPYLMRNRDIVAACSLLIAAPEMILTGEPTRGGTWYTIRYARTLHRPIIILDP